MPRTETQCISPVSLPQTGDSRFHGEATHQSCVAEERDVADRHWARADERHISDEHIPQLRKFIQRCRAKKAAQRRDAWVVAYLEDRTLCFVRALELFQQLRRVLNHAAKFEHAKKPAAVAVSLLQKEYRSLTRDFNSYRN